MPKIVDKDAKKNEILFAAMRVFAEKGVVNTKMVDIAVAAGIGKGTIYEYFRSKEDIFGAAFSAIHDQSGQNLVIELQKIDDPAEKLKTLVTISLKTFFGEHQDFLGIMMDFWAEGIRSKNEEIKQIIDLKSIYSQYRGLVIQILSDGIQQGAFRQVDTKMMASLLIGAMDGLMLQWIMEPQIFSIDQMINTLLDGFMKGISK